MTKAILILTIAITFTTLYIGQGMVEKVQSIATAQQSQLAAIQ